MFWKALFVFLFIPLYKLESQEKSRGGGQNEMKFVAGGLISVGARKRAEVAEKNGAKY